ncbi:molecular chaperone [Buttiauxella izardii]|uniref:Molecular chaperone n=1 Tax=Buttiauxella izardii TaxID=82991 RepID=A0A3A5JUE1_9ENTR|nr:molecular chaperone [Buttiauxella izardii]RJT20061.1 molecular chaperone [Buttiauxella izardii]
MRKLIIAALCIATTSVAAHAGVIIGGTRLVYNGDQKESSISINNPDSTNYLIQSWISPENEGGSKPPFIITPPLFRLKSSEENILRVVKTAGQLPEDKESLYWLDIKSVPSAKKGDNANTLQIAVKTKIKLIYRPQSISGTPEEVANKITWKKSGNTLTANNPTPFYMNLQDVKLNNKEIKNVNYLPPMSSKTYTLNASESQGNNMSWKIINDYGGISKTFTTSVH